MNKIGVILLRTETIYILVGINHIFETAEDRVIKFSTPVGHIKSQHTEDESPLKGRGHGQVTHFTFSGSQ